MEYYVIPRLGPRLGHSFMRRWCKSLRFIIVTHIGKRTSLRRPLNPVSPSRKDPGTPSRQVLAMSKQYFYAVRKGKTPGVYRTW